mgnify:CR=1 FL=1
MYPTGYAEVRQKRMLTDLERKPLLHGITHLSSLRGGDSRRSNRLTGLGIASPPLAARNDWPYT